LNIVIDLPLSQNLKNQKQMKKIATLLIAGAVVLMYSSCGPTAKEKEEKRITDSIKVADCIAMVQAEQQRIGDSVTKAMEEKRKSDSISHEDSVKKHLIKPKKAEMKMQEMKKMKKTKKTK
jgi:hypothetical protein